MTVISIFNLLVISDISSITYAADAKTHYWAVKLYRSHVLGAALILLLEGYLWQTPYPSLSCEFNSCKKGLDEQHHQARFILSGIQSDGSNSTQLPVELS